MDSGEKINANPIFRFENSWMPKGFREFVYKVWNVQIIGNNIERWQKKLRIFRQKVRGWILNLDALCRKLKKDILCKLDEIDKRAEMSGLSAGDRTDQKELRAQLGRLVKQEEMKWLQRYKDRRR